VFYQGPFVRSIGGVQPLFTAVTSPAGFVFGFWAGSGY